MQCPNEKSDLKPVEIQSHYGQPIFLDQCAQCGGVWFDETELFRARQSEASRLEQADTLSFTNRSLVENHDLKCPRDGAQLVRFTDRYFPKELILCRCPACRGIWLNRGQFTKYQGYRKRLLTQQIEQPADKSFQKQLQNLVDEHKSGNSTGTVRRLGEFLSTPVGLGSTPNDKADQAVNTFIGLLVTLLRLFIFR
ncbi:MAG: zf-TFIIB domain-containing protein [Dehalogenimonas sp.]